MSELLEKINEYQDGSQQLPDILSDLLNRIEQLEDKVEELDSYCIRLEMCLSDIGE